MLSDAVAMSKHLSHKFGARRYGTEGRVHNVFSPSSVLRALLRLLDVAGLHKKLLEFGPFCLAGRSKYQRISNFRADSNLLLPGSGSMPRIS